MGPVFRKATDKDLSHLAVLNRSVQQLHVDIEPGIFHAVPNFEHVKTFFANEMSENKNRFYIAELGDDIVGMVWAEILEGRDGLFMVRPKSFYVHHIVITPEHQRTGLGRKFFKYLRGQADALGCKNIGLDTWAKNTSALDFFVSLGFDPERVILKKTST